MNRLDIAHQSVSAHGSVSAHQSALPALVPPQPQLPANTQDVLSKLTHMERKFCEYYVLFGGNKHKAATAAGYAMFGKDSTIPEHLYKLPKVRDGIEYFELVYSANVSYTGDRVIYQWAVMASINVLDYVDDQYNLKPLSQLSPEQRRILGLGLIGLVPGKYGIQARFAKIEALENLGRLLHMYTDEKSTAQGLNLTINLSEAEISQENRALEGIGHIRLELDGDTEMDQNDFTDENENGL